MGRRTGVAAAALAMSAALLLSACDGGEEPTDPPTTEASSSASPTEPESESESTEPVDVPTPPEVEAPTPAPEAAVDDHVGAIWAARYFMDLYAYMYATGETAAFEAMSAPECEFCASSIGSASDLHQDGGWVEGGDISFDLEAATVEYPTENEPNYVVRISAEESASTTYYGNGATEAAEGSTFNTAIALRYVDGRFVVFGVNTE